MSWGDCGQPSVRGCGQCDSCVREQSLADTEAELHIEGKDLTTDEPSRTDRLVQRRASRRDRQRSEMFDTLAPATVMPDTPGPVDGLGRPETTRRSWWDRLCDALCAGPGENPRPRRVREGALSPERTPTNPPGPTRLRPLDDTSQASESCPFSWASGPVDDPGDWVKLAEAKRLGVQPDDVVVVRLGGATRHLSAEAMRQIADEAKAMFPDNRVCLFTLDGDVSVDGSAQTAAALQLLDIAEKQVAAVERMNEVAREGFEAFMATPSAVEVTAPSPGDRATLDAIRNAATAGCARQKRERIYVLASSQEHAESFARCWVAGGSARRMADCVDLLATSPRGSSYEPKPGDTVIALAGIADRQRTEEWRWCLRQRGIAVRDVEEVAACAL